MATTPVSLEQPVPVLPEVPPAPTEPPAPPAPSAELLKAREALAVRYEAKGYKNEAGYIRDGAWDREPFMLAIIDVLSPPS